jgi:DNA segregation ATPase FtsK/SpoIIIE, S-DNA-T family
MPVLEQHHLDLAGLALVALGLFLAFPLYLGWDGGAAGEAVVDSLTWAIGRVAYATPVALFAAGALLVIRPMLPALRPFRAGAVCLFGAALLAFGGGGEPVRAHGGVAGRGLHDGAAFAFSEIGTGILTAFLALAGTLLITGASVAGVLRATSSHVAETTRVLRGRRAGEEPEGGWRTPQAGELSYAPPEPPGEDPVVRPGRGAGRAELDGALRYPDLFGSPA